MEWIAIPFFRGSSQPRDQTQVFCIAEAERRNEKFSELVSPRTSLWPKPLASLNSEGPREAVIPSVTAHIQADHSPRTQVALLCQAPSRSPKY